MSKSSLNIDPPEEKPLEEVSLKDIKILGNNDISLNYVFTREILDRNKIIISNVFAFKVAFGITRSDDEIKLKTIEKYRHKSN
jgi:hypothetical protein